MLKVQSGFFLLSDRRREELFIPMEQDLMNWEILSHTKWQKTLNEEIHAQKACSREKHQGVVASLFVNTSESYG